MQTLGSPSSDAMALLFSAAEHIESEDSEEQQAHGIGGQYGQTTSGKEGDTTSPAMVSISSHIPQELLDLWTQNRFVRQGWFTPHEAIAYVN